MLNYKHTLKKVSKTKVEIEATITKADFDMEKENQYRKLSKDVEIKGFRPGKGPREAIEQRLGVKLYDETIQVLLPKVTVDIIDKEKLVPVANVEYDLKDFDLEKDLTYKATLYVYPEFEIPDFSKLSVKQETAEVSEKELDEFYENFLKDLERRKNKDIKDFDIKSVDDKWVEEQKITDVKTVSELKEYLKKYLTQEKEAQVKEKFVNDILLEASKKAGIEVPEILIENEVNARIKSDKERLEKLGIKWEDWKKQQGDNVDKQVEDLRVKLQETFKTQFLLGRIAEVNKIEVTDEDLDKILNTTPDKKVINKLGEDNVRRTLKDQLFNQKMIDWILSQVETKKS